MDMMVGVADLPQKNQETLMRQLAARLRDAGAQKIQYIFRARVPIIGFVDRRTGIECDMALGNPGGQFKSAFLGLLASYDWRVGALVRLVKLWARNFGINDPSFGTFNSFALTLLVSSMIDALHRPCPHAARGNRSLCLV